MSATNIAVRTASQAKTEGASQKATDASTPSAKNKTKPKAKPKPTSSKSPKDSTQKDTYRKWVCITCGHIYDEALGDEAEGFLPALVLKIFQTIGAVRTVVPQKRTMSSMKTNNPI